MAKLAQEAMGTKELTAIADRGYFKSEDILASHEAGISAIVAKTDTSTATAEGRFSKADFIYDAEHDEYRCPAGQRLTRQYDTTRNDMKIYRYWFSDCKSCALKDKCTPGEQRQLTRWEHEDVLDEMQNRLDKTPDAMRVRRQTVEHPYGTIKSWMGSEHFLTKTLERVSAEMSLHVLAYNMKRMINIFGVTALMEAIVA